MPGEWPQPVVTWTTLIGPKSQCRPSAHRADCMAPTPVGRHQELHFARDSGLTSHTPHNTHAHVPCG